MLGSCNLGVRGSDHMHVVSVYMTNSVCAGPHRAIPSGSGRGICTSNAVLSSSALGGRTAGTLATVSRTRRGGRRLVELLLVTQEQVSSSEASRAFWTLEGFLFGVGALVTFQVFQSGK